MIAAVENISAGCFSAMSLASSGCDASATDNTSAAALSMDSRSDLFAPVCPFLPSLMAVRPT